jgi:hypothetical protein
VLGASILDRLCWAAANSAGGVGADAAAWASIMGLYIAGYARLWCTFDMRGMMRCGAEY